MVDNMSDETLELKVDKETIKIEPKRMYVVLENEDSNSGYAAINSCKSHLLITTLKPEILKEKGNIEDLCKDDYIRIINSAKADEKYTLKQPNNLSAITGYISTWLEKHKDSGNTIIYIDKYAFQKLVNSNSGLTAMVNFVDIVGGQLEKAGKGSLILSIDPAAYEEKDHKPIIKQIINISAESGGVKVDRTSIKF